MLCAQLTGDDRLLLAAKAMEPYAARDINRLRGATPTADPTLAFCQSGESEIKALMHAASLRRHCGPDVELIAAVPSPTAAWGDLSEPTRATLHQLNVRQGSIESPIDGDSGHANKIACLAVPVRANTLVLLDSDMLCLGAPDPRVRTPLCAKVADLRVFPEGNSEWTVAFEAAGVPKPSRLVETSVDELPSPPIYDTSVVAIEATLASVVGEVWANFSRILRARRGRSKTPDLSDQIGFAIALEKLKLMPNELETRFNHPDICAARRQGSAYLCALSQRFGDCTGAAPARER